MKSIHHIGEKTSRQSQRGARRGGANRSASAHRCCLTDRAHILLCKPLFYTVYVIAVPTFQLTHFIVYFIVLLLVQNDFRCQEWGRKEQLHIWVLIKTTKLDSSNYNFTWQILHFRSTWDNKWDASSFTIKGFIFLIHLPISSSFSPVLTWPILSPSSSSSCFHLEITKMG